MSDTYTCSYCKISSDFYWLNDLEDQYFCVECNGDAVHMCSECRLSGKPIPSLCYQCQSKKKQKTEPPPHHSSAPTKAVRRCACREESVSRQVMKEGPNQGKWFQSCRSGGCRFFAWDIAQ